MALLVFQAQHDQIKAQHIRRNYALVLISSMILIWATTWLGIRIARFDLQSLVTETIVYGWMACIWLWIAWGRQRQAALRYTLFHGLLWICTSVGVIWLTKRGLSAHFLSSGVAEQPRLWWGLMYSVPPAFFLIHVWKHPLVQRHGIHGRELEWQIGTGLLVGVLLWVHMFTTIQFSGVVQLSLKPLPYLIWTLGFEFYQSWAEEVFFRGLMFRALRSVFQINTWAAIAITIVANVSIFLLKTSWRSPLEASGLLIYLSLLVLINCLLFQRFQSILPGFIVNLLFSLASIIRG